MIITTIRETYMNKPVLGIPQNTIEILRKYDFSFQKKFGPALFLSGCSGQSKDADKISKLEKQLADALDSRVISTVYRRLPGRRPSFWIPDIPPSLHRAQNPWDQALPNTRAQIPAAQAASAPEYRSTN